MNLNQIVGKAHARARQLWGKAKLHEPPAPRIGLPLGACTECGLVDELIDNHCARCYLETILERNPDKARQALGRIWREMED